jgi:hypothetical protein
VHMLRCLCPEPPEAEVFFSGFITVVDNNSKLTIIVQVSKLA